MEQKASILIVDDELLNTRILEHTLRTNGFHVESCTSGISALDILQQKTFDLVLLDVIMPGLDGYETCIRMRRNLPDLAVILVTANTDDESLNRGFEAGALDYIKKPWTPMELLARVNNILRIKSAEREKQEIYEALLDDLQTASRIQEFMLPKWIYVDDGIIFSSLYESSQLVGGDLFDKFKISPSQYIVYVGDVSGHGVQAALLMTGIKSIIKVLVETEKNELNLAGVMTRLNETLCRELFHSNYMTIIFGILDLEANTFQFINAGHPPLIEFDFVTRQCVIHREKGSLPLGWKPNFVYEDEDVEVMSLSDDRMLFLYTDGLYECTNAEGLEFGLDGLREALEREIDAPNCVTIPFQIKHYLKSREFKTANDDFTLFAIQRKHMYQDIVEVPLPGFHNPKTIMQLVQSDFKHVSKAAILVEKLTGHWTGNRELASKMELIVDEFLNNIIRHGYENQYNMVILIELSCAGDSLLLRFWDKGIAWMPESLSHQEQLFEDHDLNTFPMAGLGINLIRVIAHSFTRRRFEKVNETSILIHVPREE